jgi:hypothetical protein
MTCSLLHTSIVTSSVRKNDVGGGANDENVTEILTQTVPDYPEDFLNNFQSNVFSLAAIRHFYL